MKPMTRGFSVTVTREITESTVVEVAAETPEEAEMLALAKLRNTLDTQWEIDEGSWNRDSPYVTAVHPIA